jgi:hypothetical protein
MPFTAPLMLGASQEVFPSAILEWDSIYIPGTPLGRVWLKSWTGADPSIINDPNNLFTVITDSGNDIITYNFYGDYRFTLIQNYTTFNNLSGVWLTDGRYNPDFGTPEVINNDIFQLYNGSILTPSPATITVTDYASYDEVVAPSCVISSQFAAASSTLRVKVEYLG